MFQSFTDPINREETPKRLNALHEWLSGNGLDGFFIPRSDEFQGEYVGAHSERLAWLTGFTGSAGTGLFLNGKLHLFVDGRYTLQAKTQTPSKNTIVEDLVNDPPSQWLKTNGKSGMKFAIDPWLHTISDFKRLSIMAKANQFELTPLETNPIDFLWRDRPAPKRSDIHHQHEKYSGQSASKKCETLGLAIREKSADAFLITDPTETAWLFNIRASDVAHTPVALCFALVFANGRSVIFADEDRFSKEATDGLPSHCVCLPPDQMQQKLKELAEQKNTFWLDETKTPEAIASVLRDHDLKWVSEKSPIADLRAIKNENEQHGARQAHIRDGVAMVEFLHWLDQQTPEDCDEISAATKLENCRRHVGERFQMPLKDISFDTISGSGPNGAIIHYRVTEETNRKLDNNSLYLVDSGGQYQDGTTDITRTIAIGQPTDQMKDDFTRVLKGMIAVSLKRFPEGTRGIDLDPFARSALWAVGLDFAHGTGHGVGAYLSVHEGPQSISKRGAVALQPGMVISNEPGCYREGAYGIRIENLVLVSEPVKINGAMMGVMGFETLTLCPIDRRLIDADLLSSEERDWLNAYHTSVREELTPHLDPAASAWLLEATQPV